MFVDLEGLETAFRRSWGKDTCYPGSRDLWNEKNPALGHCAVTALIIQDYFGGELVRCLHHHHYRNRLPDWKEVDFTKEQFSPDTVLCDDGVVQRNDILYSESAKKAETLERYNILSERVEELLVGL